MQTYLTSLSDSKNTGEDTTSIHHKHHKHPTYLHTTWLQKQPLYKHSTTQHKQHHRNSFNQNKIPERTITVSLDTSKALDTVNIHTLTRKLHQTNIPHTVLKFIVNDYKDRKAYITFKNKTATQRKFKTAVLQGGVQSPTLSIYTHLTLQHHRH